MNLNLDPAQLSNEEVREVIGDLLEKLTSLIADPLPKHVALENTS